MSRFGRMLVFRRTLPIVQLLLSVATLWTVRHELTQQVKDSIRFGQVSRKRKPTPDQVYAIVVPQRLIEDEKTEFNKFEKWLPSVLNLPVGFIQLPYDALSRSKEEWVPLGLDVMTWRAMTWPFIGVLFWWSAGRGIDALLAIRKRLTQPKMTMIEAVMGALCFVFSATLAICLPILGRRPDPFFPVTLFSCGFVMWAFLGGSCVSRETTSVAIGEAFSDQSMRNSSRRGFECN